MIYNPENSNTHFTPHREHDGISNVTEKKAKNYLLSSCLK